MFTIEEDERANICSGGRVVRIRHVQQEEADCNEEESRWILNNSTEILCMPFVALDSVLLTVEPLKTNSFFLLL